MMSRYVIGFISTFSGIVIIAAITRVGYIVNDINNFYGDTMEDMKKFKIIADDAWKEMISVDGQNRPRREVYGQSDAVISNNASISSRGGCSCRETEDNCPTGPIGPQGSHGEPGADGRDGQPGRNEDSDTQYGYTRDELHSKCIPCPVGEPGPSGPDGPEGFVGAFGIHGENGQTGKHRVHGEIGSSGDAGQRGEPGTAGEPGWPGRNGQRGEGNPGPPGKPGLQGPAGDPGAQGEVGGAGADGEFGTEGFAGNSGERGLDGNEGEPGEEGLPGQDSAYCPCPSSTSSMVLY